MTGQEECVETKFGLLPVSWKILPLEAFLNSQVRARDKPNIEYKSIGIRSHGKGTFLKSRCDPQKIALEKLFEVKQGDLIVNITFAWEGAIAIANEEDDSALVSHRFPTYTFNESVIVPDFFQYVIIQKWFIDELRQISPGSAGRNRVLKKTDFIKICVPIPVIEEQKNIAHVLSTIRKAQEKEEELVASLRKLKKSLMKHLFTYGAMNLQDVAEVKLKETEIGEIPEKWKIITIDDVTINSQYGISKRPEPIGKYPMLRMNNLVNGTLDIRNLKYLFLDEREFEKYRLFKDNVLFNRTNSFELVGKTSLFNLDGDFTFGSYLVRLVIKKDEMLPAFLTLYLNWEKAQIRLKLLATKAIGQSNISASRLKTFKIPLPSIEEQKKIVSYLEIINSKIMIEEKKKQAIEQVFKSMLTVLMNAKIRLNDLEF